MPNLRISTSGVQSVDTSRVDQAEAFRRQEAMRREQLQQQAIAQQLQAQLAREGLDVQREGLGMQRELGMADIGVRRDMPGLSADAALRQQGGTGMDMMQAQIGGQERLAHISNMPAMEQLRAQNTARMLENLQALDQAWQSGGIPNQSEYDALRSMIISGGQQAGPEMGAPQQQQPQQPRSVQIGAGARFNAPAAQEVLPPAAPTGGMPEAAPPQQEKPLTQTDAAKAIEERAIRTLATDPRSKAMQEALDQLAIAASLAKGPALSEAQAANRQAMMESISEFSNINDKTARSTMDFLADLTNQVASGDMTAQEQITAVRQFYDRMQSVARLLDDLRQLVEEDPERIAASGANLENIMGSEDFSSAESVQRLRAIRDSMRKVQKSPRSHSLQPTDNTETAMRLISPIRAILDSISPHPLPNADIMARLMQAVDEALRTRGPTTQTRRPIVAEGSTLRDITFPR